MALETRLKGKEMEKTPAFENHMAKYGSLMPSLALLFHLVDMADGAYAGSVSLESTKRVMLWCDFLEAHARKVYASGLNPGIDGAHSLAEKIQEGAVTDGMQVREIYRHHWSGLRTQHQVAAALDVLASHNWLWIESQDTGGDQQKS
jgi:hypothetical protein